MATCVRIQFAKKKANSYQTMKIASTDTEEYLRQKEKNGGREENRNLWIALLQGTFVRISFAFADPTTVLPAFVYKLT